MDSSNGKLVLAFNVFPDECGGVNEQSQAYPFLDDAVPGGRCGGLCTDPQTVTGRVYGELGVQPVNCLCAPGGIAITYRQVFVLFPEMRWIAQFRTGNAGLSVLQEPRLLKPLARQLDDDSKRDRFSLSTMSLRTVLDGIHSRMDEQREITRYFISLLIFLGLLGTFWGLLGTINSVGAVIVNLDMSQEDFGKVFAGLQSGLLEPLEGMGTAFSSSLLGLGGSLVLGFLDIQAGHAQNRFYDGLEEWLTGVTNLVDRVDDDPR